MSAILNPIPPAPEAKPALVPAPEKPKRTWLWAVLSLVIAGLAGAAWWSNQSATQEKTSVVPVKTTTVVAGKLENVIRISGQTSSREYANITVPRLNSPEGNRPMVLQKLTPSGVMVKKGDMLVQIDGQSMADHIDDVHSTVLQAEADIRKRQAEQQVEWENLQQSVRLAKAQLDKSRADAKASEVRTGIDQELLKLQVEESEAAYNELLSELKLKQQSHASEMKILDYTRERHTRHRDRHKKDLERFTIHASMDGLAVVQTVWRGGEFQQIGDGDTVTPGQLIVKVVNPKSMQVEASINQAESGLFRLGQTANVTLDAFPGLTLKGKVYSIGAIAVAGFRQQAFLRSIPVRVAIDGADPRLIPDLSAGANVVVDQTENATLVPLGALRPEDGKQVAYVKQGQQFVRREVKLAGRNEITGAVASGLSAGDEVALNYEVAAVAVK